MYKALIEWKVIQGYKHKYSQNSLLFGNDSLLRSYSGTKRLLDRFNKKYGYENYNIHFHSFRHTFATILFEKKVNPKIIQLLLGHKSVKTTLEIYNNVNIYNDEMLKIIQDAFK